MASIEERKAAVVELQTAFRELDQVFNDDLTDAAANTVAYADEELEQMFAWVIVGSSGAIAKAIVKCGLRKDGVARAVESVQNQLKQGGLRGQDRL